MPAPKTDVSPKFQQLLQDLMQCHVNEIEALRMEQHVGLLPEESPPHEVVRSSVGPRLVVASPNKPKCTGLGLAAELQDEAAFPGETSNGHVGVMQVSSSEEPVAQLEEFPEEPMVKQFQENLVVSARTEDEDLAVSPKSEYDEEHLGAAGNFPRLRSPEEIKDSLDMRSFWQQMGAGQRKDSATAMDDTKSAAGDDFMAEEPVEEVKIERSDHRMARYIVLPGHKLRLAWDLFGGALIMFDMFKIPLGAFQPDHSVFADTFMGWLTLLFWTVDVPSTFFVAYVDSKSGVTVVDPTKILRHYAFSWLIIDLAVVIPDWMFTIVALQQSSGNQQDGNSVRMLRGLRLARAVRLLRIVKLAWIVDMIVDYLDSEFAGVMFSITRMLLALLVINHFFACAWYAVGTLHSGQGWVQEPDFLDTDWTWLYLSSMHWSLTQFTPASMSIQPTTKLERLFALLTVFFALVIFSYIVGSITGSLAQLRQIASGATRDYWLLRRYLQKNHVPTTLSLRIVRFVQHAYNRQQEKMSVSQVSLLKLLSSQLNAELQCSLNLPHLKVHPLFNYLNDAATVTLNKVAQDAVTRIQMARGDTLFLLNQDGAGMYFVISGRILYSRDTEMGPKRELVDADEDWIAEPVLWVESWLHLGEARAYADSELLMVSPTQFETILKTVKPIARTAARYARRFMEWLEQQEYTDVIQGDEESETIEGFID